VRAYIGYHRTYFLAAIAHGGFTAQNDPGYGLNALRWQDDERNSICVNWMSVVMQGGVGLPARVTPPARATVYVNVGIANEEHTAAVVQDNIGSVAFALASDCE
jgi:hypothetical protein